MSGSGHIAAIGSSTTYGIGTTKPSERWVDRFMAGLAARGLPVDPTAAGPLDVRALTPQDRVTLVDGALPGTMAGSPLINPAGSRSLTENYAVVYLVGLISAEVMGQQPTIVFHMVGANDYGRGIDPRWYADGLEFAADMFPSNTIHLFIGAYQPPGVTRARFPWSSYADAMRKVVAKDPSHRLFLDLAPWFNAAKISASDPHGLVSPDGWHPTPTGHAAIAQLVLRGIGMGC
ncbi:MAG: SGNH/GDSL hydrolase family protein [Nocardioides sp.]|uniref:SGNH/GDSL hydrolase family protein n=1 Tax=Nocardioides sp. TaxID=35761 RepID=UPI0039E6F532